MDDNDSSDCFNMMKHVEMQQQPQQQPQQQQQHQPHFPLPPSGGGDSGCHSASSLSPLPTNQCESNPTIMVNGQQQQTQQHQHQQTQEMADRFVRWFYDLLNAGQNEFKASHFFPDASADILLRSAASNVDEAAAASSGEAVQVRQNGQEVCSALLAVAARYSLTFNPNLCSGEGVRGVMDQHGLVLVSACGTLHSSSTRNCIGIFHQQFGLVRDPFDGHNWKIKFTKASLTSRPVTEQPSLASMPHEMLQQQQPQQQSTAMALS